MRIIVIGAGYVGLSSAVALARLGHSLRVVEREPGRLAQLQAGGDPLGEAGMVRALSELNISFEGAVTGPTQLWLVAVGTPSAPDGSVDLRQLWSALEQICQVQPTASVVVRSTVPPGTMAALSASYPHVRLAHIPEFLREGAALRDASNPWRVVIGGPPDLCEELAQIYGAMSCPIIQTDWASAELCKVAANTLLASRVAVINEIARVAKASGADMKVVQTVAGLDPRIGHHYLSPGVGFGGSCLPKDVLGLARWGADQGLALPAITATYQSNQDQLAWVISQLPPGATRVALWGLAFKRGSADTRNSRGLHLVFALCARGVQVCCYDPTAPESTDLPVGATRCEDWHHSLRDADCLIMATACGPAAPAGWRPAVGELIWVPFR